MSTKNNTGIELGLASGQLFDSAAWSWYLGLLLQIIAGVIAALSGQFTSTDDSKLFTALLAFAVLAASYILKLQFDEKYDRAETMRRQSVFTEGLNWSIGATQMSVWRSRMGQKIMNKVSNAQRPSDYFQTTQKFGPRKLLEMTRESAFYTRHLYERLNSLIWILFIGSIILSFLVVSILPSKTLPQSLPIQVAYIMYLLLPILLSIDLLGWALKLKRLQESILEVEKDLERVAKKPRLEKEQVIRLVSEYNCQVACGIAIHPWLWQLWHEEIRILWNKYSGNK